MKINKTQQIIIGVLVSVLISVFAYYQFILKPLNESVAKLRSELQDKQQKLESAKQVLAKYDEFKKKASSTLRELEWAQNRMPVQLERSKFIEGVSALQTRSGVSLTSFRFQSQPSSKDFYVEVPADIRFSANFEQLMKFLYEVGLSKNLMIVHDLKLTNSLDATSNNSSQTLSASMVLSGIQGKKQ